MFNSNYGSTSQRFCDIWRQGIQRRWNPGSLKKEHRKWVHHSIACLWFPITVIWQLGLLTLSIKCTVFEIWRLATYWSKIAKKPTPLSIGTFHGVPPCEFFDKSYLAKLPETRIMGLSDGVHFTILLLLC